MHILVTNDDGVFAPGLAALAAAFRKLGAVTVIAPDRNCSASGHVKTMHRPLRVLETKLADGSDAMSTDGAPSDCVSLAVLGLVEAKLDLVVSGINPLANLGHDVTYSGTVTAAMEATIRGLPGIALSLDSNREIKGDLDYGPAANIGLQISRQIIEHGLPKGVLLNINVPSMPFNEIKGVKMTQQGQREYRGVFNQSNDRRRSRQRNRDGRRYGECRLFPRQKPPFQSGRCLAPAFQGCFSGILHPLPRKREADFERVIQAVGEVQRGSLHALASVARLAGRIGDNLEHARRRRSRIVGHHWRARNRGVHAM